MMARDALRRRLTVFEARLAAERPDLQPLLRACREVDRLLRRMGLLARADSVATRLPWWAVVAVLGPATPAKAAFVDGFRAAGKPPAEGRVAVLGHGQAPVPGDPRVPTPLADGFLGEASDSDRLRGLLVMDVPDDAPPQGSADAPPGVDLIELADLVVVFAGADGALPDALARRLDTAARRADAGKIVTVRSEGDLAGIDARLAEAAAARARRVAGLIGAAAGEPEEELVPYVRASLARWRRGVWRGGLLWSALLLAVFGGAVVLGGWENLPAFGGWLLNLRPAPLHGMPLRLLVLLAGFGGLWLAGCCWVRRAVAGRLAADLPTSMGEADLDPRGAFLKSAGAFRIGVAGWGRRTRRRLAAIRAEVAAPLRASGEGRGHASHAALP